MNMQRGNKAIETGLIKDLLLVVTSDAFSLHHDKIIFEFLHRYAG